MSHEESAIFFANLACIPHIRQTSLNLLEGSAIIDNFGPSCLVVDVSELRFHSSAILNVDVEAFFT